LLHRDRHLRLDGDVGLDGSATEFLRQLCSILHVENHDMSPRSRQAPRRRRSQTRGPAGDYRRATSNVHDISFSIDTYEPILQY
jgi:hypothetical protein